MANWFEKRRSGLKKSSDKISTGISDIFTKRKIDGETLEELEELLLVSDIGYEATSEIIKNFSTKKMNKDADDIEIKRALSDEVENILRPCKKEFTLSASKPHVILMVGVNGAGKTTTIGKLAHKLKGKKYH